MDFRYTDLISSVNFSWEITFLTSECIFTHHQDNARSVLLSDRKSIRVVACAYELLIEPLTVSKLRHSINQRNRFPDIVPGGCRNICALFRISWMSQHVSEACGQLIAPTKDIPGPSTQD